jgi:ketosteroid isomerase-like protein
VLALAERSPDYRFRVAAVLALGDSAVAFLHRLSGAQPPGGDFESSGVLIATFRDGRCERLELYAVDEVNTALDRFTALTRT